MAGFRGLFNRPDYSPTEILLNYSFAYDQIPYGYFAALTLLVMIGLVRLTLNSEISLPRLACL